MYVWLAQLIKALARFAVFLHVHPCVYAQEVRGSIPGANVTHHSIEFGLLAPATTGTRVLSCTCGVSESYARVIVDTDGTRCHQFEMALFRS